MSLRPSLALRFRRRLALAFVAVAGGATALLAVGSFLLVRDHRLGAAEERALQQAAIHETLAERVLSSPPEPEEIDELLSLYRERGGMEAVISVGRVTRSSSPWLQPQDIPAEVANTAWDGPVRTEIDGRLFTVIGARSEPSGATLWLFPLERIQAQLWELGVVLVAGWAAVVLLAAAAGSFLARRTLQPVAEAERAARSLAEGLLDTRLPADRRDEFGKWASSFNAMADALETKVRELIEAGERERRFTADVAHELKTPTAALVAEASLLRRHLDTVPERARRPVELLLGDVDRLRGLVDDLLETSRLESLEGDAWAEPVDLGGLVRRVVASRDREHAVEIRGHAAIVLSDPSRLDRIVGNLVDNAIQHGGTGVVVEMRTEDREAIVEVSDRGPGIGPEHLPRVFDRFYKTDPSRSDPGSGLGLAIARQAAAAVGGDIGIWSRPGEGTRVTLRLPMATDLGSVPTQREVSFAERR